MLLIIQHSASDYLYITQSMYVLIFGVCLLMFAYLIAIIVSECEVHFWIEDKLQSALCKIGQKVGIVKKN